MKKIYTFSEFLLENTDYMDDDGHSAPTKEDGSPMHDLTGTYPEDIYSEEGVRYYGDDAPDYSDHVSMSIIRRAKGKPNMRVTIYRAVPDFNYDINKKKKELNDILNYQFKYGFFPMRNAITSALEDKYKDYDYYEQKDKVREDLYNQIAELMSQRKKGIKINNGDWVTINKEYARVHGRDNLNSRYKIVSKTVKASELYSEGNSLHEWGYSI
jgi:hypothetical protein